MAAWEKEYIVIGPFYEYPTGNQVLSGITDVDLLPTGNTWPTGKIACTAGSVNKAVWFPDDDLDDEENYYIYVNSTLYGILPSKYASPPIGG